MGSMAMGPAGPVGPAPRPARIKAYRPGGTNPWLTALAVAPSQLLYALETGTFNTCIPVIAESLQMETSVVQWLIHAELLVCCSLGAVSSKLADRFGIGHVFRFGVWTFSIFTFLIVFLPRTFVGILVMRILASIGLACCIPLANPMGYRLVAQGKLPTVLTINSVCSPLGQIMASLIAGVMAGSIGWQYMTVVIAAIGAIYGVFLFFALPGSRPNKAVKIDFLGLFLILAGIAPLIAGLTLIADGFVIWGAVLIILLAIGMLALFWVYNWRWSRAPIFSKEIFNRSAVCNMVAFMLVACAGFGERFYLPYIMMRIYGLNSTLNGVVNSLNGVVSVCFSPLWQFVLRKMVARYLAMIYAVVYIGGCVLEASLLGRNLGLTIFSVMLNMLFYMALTITIQTASLTSAPLRHSAAMGSLNTVMMNLGHTLGISVAVSVQSSVIASLTGSRPDDPSQNYLDSISMAVYAMISFPVIIIILAFFMGINKQDRGKVGFSERYLNRSSTFRENLENNSEMVELKEDDDDGRQFEQQMEASLWLPKFV